MLRVFITVAIPMSIVLGGLNACSTPTASSPTGDPAHAASSHTETAMLIEYLEIVTPEVDATCDTLAQTHGVTFSEPAPGLGGARTAALRDGGRIGVRAPMAAHETAVVRPYVLVDDIEAAVAAATAAGAEIAHPPLEIPGEGTFAIYILGGVQHGLWQR